MVQTIKSSSYRILRLVPRCYPVATLWMMLMLTSGRYLLCESLALRLSPPIHSKAMRATAATFLSCNVSPSIGSPSQLSTSSSSSLLSSLSSRQEKQQLLEVEEKFFFSNRSELEERLRREGFASVQEVTMIDLYFDRLLAAGGRSNNDESSDGDHDNDRDRDNHYYLELPLVRNDHWLRFREITSQNGVDCCNGGEWELKRGTSAGKDCDGGATVYEEIEGIRAVEIACSVVQEQSKKSPSRASASTTRPSSTDTEESTPMTPLLRFDGHSIPILPIDGCGLEPFARIVTHRAKWKQQHQSGTTSTTTFQNLVVDLDTTPDGFAVGEVEALVGAGETEDQSIPYGAETATNNDNNQDAAITQARADIRRFLVRILDHEGREDDAPERRRPPMGKLGQYLFQNQPQIHKVCVESGVIPEPSPTEASK